MGKVFFQKACCREPCRTAEHVMFQIVHRFIEASRNLQHVKGTTDVHERMKIGASSEVPRFDCRNPIETCYELVCLGWQALAASTKGLGSGRVAMS